MGRTCGSVLKVQLHSTSVVLLMVTRKSRICTFQSIKAAANGFSFSRWLMSTHFLRADSAAHQESPMPLTHTHTIVTLASDPSLPCSRGTPQQRRCRLVA